MKRRLTLALAAAGLAAAMVPTAASAGAPVGGCPAGANWSLIVPMHQPQPADHNGDGRLCLMDLANGSFTFFDNVVQ